jgi:hypothetical protein
VVNGSIRQENLEPFVTTLSWLIGYTITDDDWQKIKDDLFDGSGGSYDFVGNQPLSFQVAIDRNSAMLKIAVFGPEALEPEVELAISIFHHFRLRK